MSQLANVVPNVYSPESATVVIGTVEVYGYGDSDAIALSKGEDLIIPKQGVMRDVVLSKNNNTLGTLTLTLWQNSPFNRTLSTWVLTTDTVNTQYPVFPVTFSDKNADVGFITTGWIQTQPDWADAKEVGTVDWVIGLADARLRPNQGASVVEQLTAGIGTTL